MDIKKLIYGEVDNSCGYCGQKGLENITKHHIDGGRNNNNYENLIVLCHNCHHRFHNNKGITKDNILDIKRTLIEKTLMPIGVNAIKTAYRNNGGVIAMPYQVVHLIDLGYLLRQQAHMQYISDIGKGEVIDATAFYVLTDKGKLIYDKWLK